MKTLKEVLSSKKPKVYCDMDGVVADFAEQVKIVYGPNKTIKDVLPFRNLPGDWFLNLPKMKDADELMRGLKKYDVEMLTGIPGKNAMPDASTHKKQWMRKNYGLSSNKVHTVFASDKPKFAVLNGIANILIDDTQENIDKWESKGGKGIFHTSAASSLAKLEQIMAEEISENIRYKNEKANGYFAVMLDKKSESELKKTAIYPIVVSEHVTIAYKPSKEVAKRLEKNIGKRYDVIVKKIMNNENIQAVVVDVEGLKRVDPGIAHVTISHNSNAKPVDSNRLVLNPENEKPIKMFLSGILKFVSFK
jgi:hypothetical protein